MMGLGNEIRSTARWLGRQVGYLHAAVKPTTTAEGSQAHTPADQAAKAADPAESVLWQKTSVQQQPHPEDPELQLRRTIIDQVIQSPADDVADEEKPA